MREGEGGREERKEEQVREGESECADQTAICCFNEFGRYSWNSTFTDAMSRWHINRMPFKREKRKRETKEIIIKERNKYFSEIISFPSIFIFVGRAESGIPQRPREREKKEEKWEWWMGIWF
jgi:hypothetical protein